MNSMLKLFGHELKYWSIVKTVTHKFQNYVPATIKIEKTFQKKPPNLHKITQLLQSCYACRLPTKTTTTIHG